jgi:hypothetical protein
MSSRLIGRQVRTCLTRHRQAVVLTSSSINNFAVSGQIRLFCSAGDGAPKKSFQDTLNKMKKDSENSDAIVPPAPGSAAPKVDAKDSTEGVEGEVKMEEKEEGVEAPKEGDAEASAPSSFNWGAFTTKLADMGRSTVSSVSSLFQEKPKSALDYEVEKSYLRRKIHQALTFTQTAEARVEGEDGYDGPREMVWVKDPLSPWDSMKARMAQSPLIKDLLKRTFKVTQAASETTAGKKLGVAGQAVQDKIDDVREYWETTQNPVVYSLAGAWENVTGETEEGQCIRDFQKLDPHFNKEEWAAEVCQELVPAVIKAHLSGNISPHRKIMGEAVYQKLIADIRIRKQEGLVFDSTVIDCEERAVELKYPEGSDSAYIVGHYAVQQLYCVKNREGEIIEGDESDIRMRIYTMLFQQHLEEVPTSLKTPSGAPVNEHYMVWKIVDYQFGEMIPYL